MILDSLPKTQSDSVDVADRPNVLLIEDDRDQCDFLGVRLTRQGYNVVASDRGKIGFQLACDTHPDLILLDLGLPDIDGLQLCEQLADHTATAEIPVIIVSASDQDDIIRRSRLAGSRFFVHKPYDPNALLLLIQNALADELV